MAEINQKEIKEISVLVKSVQLSLINIFIKDKFPLINCEKVGMLLRTILLFGLLKATFRGNSTNVAKNTCAIPYLQTSIYPATHITFHLSLINACVLKYCLYNSFLWINIPGYNFLT